MEKYNKNSLIERIRELERSSSGHLEPDAETRSMYLRKIDQYVHDYLENIDNLPAYVEERSGGSELQNFPISEQPVDLDTVLQLFESSINQPGVKPGSPGYLAFIPGGGLYHSALGDYLAAITNKYAGIYFAGPGAVRLERMLIQWMAHFIGYPETAAGDISSGGSIATLTAIVTAREAHHLKARDFSKSVVYLTKQTHHCVEKALRIAGLKECKKRFIPLDDTYHLNVNALERAIKRDKQAELYPWLIVASAGTTDTGAVDPLYDIVEIAKDHNLWLHVDGAYGAAFALCNEGKEILRGIEHSDSLIMDPHKGLFLPFGTGVVLVNDAKKMQQAHYYDANYLKDKDRLSSSDELSPAELSPELSRHFRGLRLWLPLMLIGVAPFRAALQEKLLLARYFHQRLRTVDGFEVGPFPDLSIVTFRYIPKKGDHNAFNQKLNEAVQKDGRIFLSSTNIDGQFTMRVVVLGFRTHLDNIELALEILQEKAKEIEEMI